MRRSDPWWIAAIIAAAGCSVVYDTDSLSRGGARGRPEPGAGSGGAGSGGSPSTAGSGNATSGSASTGDGGVGATTTGSGATGNLHGVAGDDDNGTAGTPSLGTSGAGGEPVLDCSTMLYPDADGDGYGDDSQPGVDCETPGYAPPGDCDDGDYFNNPGLTELCDGIDNDCNPDTDDVCPLNCLWDHPQGRRIHLFCWYPTQTWADASEICASQLMQLVKIESQSEQDYVLSWHDPDTSWLGGSDAGEEGTWKWQDGDVFWDGAATDLYAHWGGGEPSNSGNEDCLLLNGTATPDSWWNDHSCTDPRPFTCERY